MLTLLLAAMVAVCVSALLGWLRTERRARLQAELERLEEEARKRPGFAHDRPIDVLSPSVVEGKARAMACPLCGGALKVNDHAAETIGGQRLRLAYVTCIGCGSSRALYFRIKAPPS